MNCCGLWLALLICFSSSHICLAQQGSKSRPAVQLESDLSLVRQGFCGQMAIYMKNLATGEEIALDADTVYETFSVIKLAIAAEVLHQVETGKFSLAERVTVKASDRRLPSGVLYALDPGLQPTIKDLLTLMIIISDNEATDLLAARVGRNNVTQYMRSLGLAKTSIEFSDLDWDRTWLGTLDTAHKTGDGQPFIANDAGILWVNKQPVVLVVFTGHHRGETAALHDTIARVAALVVQHYGGRLTSDFVSTAH